MRTLTIRPRSRWLLPAVIGVSLFSCGYQKKVEFRSPSGAKVVRILQPRLDNAAGMEIVVEDRSGRHLIYHSPGEVYVYFAEATWSRGEDQVAVLVSGASVFPVAYDFRSAKMIPFTPFRERMNAAIARDYNRSPDTDLIAWASSNEAFDEFRRRHP